MKNLDASLWFSDPRLVVIKTDEKDRRRQAQFTLQVKRLTQPKSADNAPADAGGEEVLG